MVHCNVTVINDCFESFNAKASKAAMIGRTSASAQHSEITDAAVP